MTKSQIPMRINPNDQIPMTKSQKFLGFGIWDLGFFSKPYLCWEVLVIFLFFILCFTSPLLAKEVEKLKDEDGLYNQALDYFKEESYDKAIEAFNDLINSYPKGRYTTMAQLRIGESYFLKEDFTNVLKYLEDFKKLHPTNPQIPYVIYLIGSSYFYQTLKPGKEQENTKKAIEQFEYLILRYPNSPSAKKAQEKLDICKRNLVEHEMDIALLYHRKKAYKAALKRFTKVLDFSPPPEISAKVLYHMADSFKALEDQEKQRETLYTLVNNYSNSEYAEKAKKELKELGEGKVIAKKSPEKKEEIKALKESKTEERKASGEEEKRVGEEEGIFTTFQQAAIEAKVSPKIQEEIPKATEESKPKREESPELKESLVEEDLEEDLLEELGEKVPEKAEEAQATSPMGRVKVEKKKSGSADFSKPINIASDMLEANEAENRVTFKGNVVAKQGDIVMFSDVLATKFMPDRKSLDKIIALGNVKITQKNNVATCKKAVYYNQEKKLILTGNPRVWQGDDTIKGEKIVMYIEEDKVVVEGGKDGRVNATINPSSFQ